MYIEDIEEKYAINKIESCLNKIESLFETGVRRLKNQKPDDFRFICLFILRKSIVTTREVVALCKEGFPDGAMSLARNVFEQFIIILFLKGKQDTKEFDDIILKYMDDYTVQRNKALLFEAERVQSSVAEVEKISEELNKIKEKHHITSLKDYWWSGKNNFQEICDTVASANSELEKAIRIFQLYYKRACLALHSSYMGNVVRLGASDEVIDMGPWDKGQETPLYLCTVSLPTIVDITFSLLDINQEDILDCTQALYHLTETYIIIGKLRKTMDQEY